MNLFDILLLILACVLVVIGMVKGLVRILIGLAALVAAFALAARFHQPLADRLGWISLPEQPLMLIAYVGIFLGVMLAGGVVAYLTRKLIRAAMLSWADRIGGAALGLVIAMLGTALLILPLVAYSPSGHRLLRRSVLAPYVTVLADLASPLVPNELSRLYREGMDDLRLFWRERTFDEHDRQI